MDTITQPTQQVCPESGYDDTHHLVPRYRKNASTLVCLYCGKTESELREALAC